MLVVFQVFVVVVSLLRAPRKTILFQIFRKIWNRMAFRVSIIRQDALGLFQVTPGALGAGVRVETPQRLVPSWIQ
jgi:hypothetical protein